MSVLLYANRKDGAGGQLEVTLREQGTIKRIQVYRSIATLAPRLRRLNAADVVTVLVAETRPELFDLLTLQHLVKDFRLILLLPDRDKATVSAGHLLRPRFVSYVDANLEPVVAVVTGLLEIDRRRRSAECIALPEADLTDPSMDVHPVDDVVLSWPRS
jgi:hypothetical protein